jgi:hypothetical protein
LLLLFLLLLPPCCQTLIRGCARRRGQRLCGAELCTTMQCRRVTLLLASSMCITTVSKLLLSK